MNDYELTWYMQEISMHGLGAEVSFENLLKTVSDQDMLQTRLVWFHLTSFLTNAAMVSKYVSPISSRGIKLDRMNVLKRVLKVDADSEVLPRNSRDNIEHFDERIDNWIGADSQTILEVVLQDRAAFNYLKANEKRVKRLLIVDEFVFISENRNGTQVDLELWPLFAEVKRIGDTATNWIESSSPYKFLYPQQQP